MYEHQLKFCNEINLLKNFPHDLMEYINSFSMYEINWSNILSIILKL